MFDSSPLYRAALIEAAVQPIITSGKVSIQLENAFSSYADFKVFVLMRRGKASMITYSS